MLINDVTIGLSTVALGTSIFLGLWSVHVAQRSAEIAQRNLKVTTYQDVTQLVLELDSVFIEHPDMRPYFYDDRPLPEATRMTEAGGERTRSQVLAVAEFMLDTFECIWDHNEKNEDEEDRSAWMAYIKGVFSRSPPLRTAYRTFQYDEGWYPSLFSLESELQGLDPTFEFAPIRAGGASSSLTDGAIG